MRNAHRFHSKSFIIFIFRATSKRSGTSSTTTTILISQLAKQLEEEREARKKLQEELDSIKQMSQ
jgi:hypothetical protein